MKKCIDKNENKFDNYLVSIYKKEGRFVMSKGKNTLTEGSVGKRLIWFSMPFLLSNILQSIYGLADFFVVMNFGSELDGVGVNTGSQLTMLVTNVIVGLTTGGTVMVSQYLGAKKEKDVKETIGTLLSVMLILSAVVTVVMLLVGKPFATLLQTPENAMKETLAYYNICMMGSVFVFGYNVISAVLRGMGDSKNPLIFVTIACVINIILDIVLVKEFHMGSKGAAYATVIAQALSLIFAIIYLSRIDFIFDFKLSSFKIIPKKMSKIFALGLPTAIQNTISTTSFLFMLSLINSYGTGANVASGCVSKINGFAILPGIAMMMSIAAMAGQNIGAGEDERAMKTLKIGAMISFAIGAVIFVFIQLFPEVFLGMFNVDSDALAYGVEYIRGFSIDYLIVPTAFCCNGLITGSGHTLYVAFITIATAIVVRVPVAFLLAKVVGMGMIGVGLAVPISSVFMLTCSLIFIKLGKWKIRVIKA